MGNSYVVLDADGIIAQVNKADPHHKKAITLTLMLAAQGIEFLFPTTAIAEAITVLKFRKKDNRVVIALIDSIQTWKLTIADITHKTTRQTIQFFDPKSSKRNTFFDAIVVAIARKHNARAVFSFDGWYRKKGFKLVEDL